MSDLLDLVVDTFPANNDTGVPLLSAISITLSGLNYDEDSLKESFFVEGPDTDQFVGPGQIELQNNVSQGELNDFLQSPGYKGIVGGTVTVSGVAGNTVVTFTPNLPLAPNLLYVVNLTGILDSTLVEIDGFASFSFETGSGSIEQVPSTVSTSVLSAGLSEAAILLTTATEPLKIISTSPIDRSVQNSPSLSGIVVTFNKPIDPSSVDTSKFIVRASPISDHPNATVSGVRELTKTVEVVGNQLIITV